MTANATMIQPGRLSLDPAPGSYSRPPLEWLLDDPWFRKVDLNEVKDIILNFRSVVPCSMKAYIPARIEWSLKPISLEMTKFDLGASFNPLTEEAIDFILEHRLQEGVTWLQTAAPKFFPGANFEIDILPSEDDESNLIALRVYSSFPVREFRKRRHLICEAMLEAGYKHLYEMIIIFQRRVRGGGWQAFSWYSTISEE
jgi:hypothetical protein